MVNYSDSAAQTEWAGLMQQSVRPETLLSAPQDTTTPPAEMADMVTEKPQFHTIPQFQFSRPNGNSNNPGSSRQTIIERRANHPGLVARIDMPRPELNDEVPLSPPPTARALLSPLPEANTRHAGHTPLLDRARSPEAEAKDLLDSQAEASSSVQQNDPVQTAEDDEALTGSLILPTDPSAAHDDSNFISLDRLDHELDRIARQQRHLRGDFSDDEGEPAQERSGSEPSAAPVQSENQPPPVSSPMLARPGSLDPNSGPLLPTTSASPPSASSPPPMKSLTQHLQSTAIVGDGQEEDLPLSRKGSAESTNSRRSGATDEVDGVILKTPPSNFGTPIGQL